MMTHCLSTLQEEKSLAIESHVRIVTSKKEDKMKEKCPMCGKELTGVGFLRKYCEYCKDPEKYKLPQGIS